MINAIYEYMEAIGARVKCSSFTKEDILSCLTIIERLFLEINDSPLSLQEKALIGDRIKADLGCFQGDAPPICYVSEGVVKCPEPLDEAGPVLK